MKYVNRERCSRAISCIYFWVVLLYFGHMVSSLRSRTIIIPMQPATSLHYHHHHCPLSPTPVFKWILPLRIWRIILHGNPSCYIQERNPFIQQHILPIGHWKRGFAIYVKASWAAHGPFLVDKKRRIQTRKKKSEEKVEMNNGIRTSERMRQKNGFQSQREK